MGPRSLFLAPEKLKFHYKYPKEMVKNSKAFQTVFVERGNTGKGGVLVGRILSSLGKAFSAFFKMI